MVKFFAYIVLFFLVVILQTVVVPHIEILGARPSFLLILTIIVALRHGTLAGCSMGFISGLLCDVYAPVEWLGAYSLAYCIIGFAVGQIEESFINLNPFPQIVVLAVSDFLKDIIYFIAIGKTSEEILHALISITFPNTVYTACFGAICFYLLTPRKEKKVAGIYRPGK